MARTMLPMVCQIQAAGATTFRAIATALSDRGVRTARGGAWHDSTARAGGLIRQSRPAAGCRRLPRFTRPTGAPYQSPTYRAVVIAPPPAPDATKEITLKFFEIPLTLPPAISPLDPDRRRPARRHAVYRSIVREVPTAAGGRWSWSPVQVMRPRRRLQGARHELQPRPPRPMQRRVLARLATKRTGFEPGPPPSSEN
jgi:hypothetical protein